MRVPWTARRYNQSILKEISVEYSLERLKLKLKLQYFGHLMGRADSFEKILMLGTIEGRRRREQQRNRGAWWGTVHGVAGSPMTEHARILNLQPMCGSSSSLFQMLKLHCCAGFLFCFVLSARVVNFILLNSVPCPFYQGKLGTLLFYPI